MRILNIELFIAFIAFIALCVAAWSAHKTNQTSIRQAKQSWYELLADLRELAAMIVALTHSIEVNIIRMQQQAHGVSPERRQLLAKFATEILAIREMVANELELLQATQYGTTSHEDLLSKSGLLREHRAHAETIAREFEAMRQHLEEQ